MLRMMIAGLMLVAGVNGANAAARNFFSPSMLGDRIAFCTQSSDECGKPVADAWCVQQGFDRAMRFQRDRKSITENGIAIRAVDTGNIYTGSRKISFRQIKCYSSGS